MPVRPILRYPDPALKQVARPVEAFDEDLRRLADDLVDTMRAAPAVGITAPHIGVPLRVVVLFLPGDPSPRIYVNPQVTFTSTEMETHVEGSVSMPGVTENIVRPRAVQIAHLDLNGRSHVEDADGFRAACHQHEIDQLDGIFWIQRLSALRRERIVSKYRKLVRRS